MTIVEFENQIENLDIKTAALLTYCKFEKIETIRNSFIIYEFERLKIFIFLPVGEELKKIFHPDQNRIISKFELYLLSGRKEEYSLAIHKIKDIDNLLSFNEITKQIDVQSLIDFHNQYKLLTKISCESLNFKYSVLSSNPFSGRIYSDNTNSLLLPMVKKGQIVNTLILTKNVTSYRSFNNSGIWSSILLPQCKELILSSNPFDLLTFASSVIATEYFFCCIHRSINQEVLKNLDSFYKEKKFKFIYLLLSNSLSTNLALLNLITLYSKLFSTYNHEVLVQQDGEYLLLSFIRTNESISIIEFTNFNSKLLKELRTSIGCDFTNQDTISSSLKVLEKYKLIEYKTEKQHHKTISTYRIKNQSVFIEIIFKAVIHFTKTELTFKTKLL